MTIKKLLPHQQRVIVERDELGHKVQALSEFIDSPMFGQTPPIDQEHLKEQKQAMWKYYEVLGKRIALF